MLQPPRRAILVGVDGSAAALAAVRWAAHDAALRMLPLTWSMSSTPPYRGGPRSPAPAGFRQWQEKRAREFIKSAIKVAEESTGERGPVQIDSKVFIRPPSRRSSAFPKRRRWSWWATGAWRRGWSATSLAR